MTERPIIFSGPMVRALLREVDPKTQTRRVLRPQPPEKLADSVHYDRATGGAMWASIHGDHGVACPYGKPGDRLWVRETFIHEPATYCWEASTSIPAVPASTVYRADADPQAKKYGPWTPAIHMPRAACRLVLEVIGVRVERLRDITSDDAIAEGIEPHHCGDAAEEEAYNKANYMELWDSLNAKRGYGWDVNPWVWVIEFKRADALKAAA